MPWFYLFLAGIFEIGFAISLKLTEGFTKVIPIITFFIFSIFGMWFLNKAMQSIPVGTAYAIWTGIGAVGVTIIGIFWFKDPVNFWRMFFMCTIIVSLVGLKVATKV